MGYGTNWQLGHESETRLLWEGQFPVGRKQIDVKFITSLELQMLRCKLQGLTTFDPKIKVYEMVFPNATDPEYEEWYKNIETEYDRAIEIVRLDFLQELQAIKASEVQSLGAEWGASTEGWWHKQWPDHAAWALCEFIGMATEANEQNMCVFAKQFL